MLVAHPPLGKPYCRLPSTRNGLSTPGLLLRRASGKNILAGDAEWARTILIGSVEVSVAKGRELQKAPSARQGMLRAQPQPSPELPALCGSFNAEAPSCKLGLASGWAHLCPQGGFQTEPAYDQGDSVGGRE